MNEKKRSKFSILDAWSLSTKNWLLAANCFRRPTSYRSRKTGFHVSTSTVQYFRLAYQHEAKEKKARDEEEITRLLCRKRGRTFLIGEKIDSQVQSCLKKVHEGGSVVTARIAVAAARGINFACGRSELTEFGGHIYLNPSWRYSLLGQMNFVRRKATTAKSKFSLERLSKRKSKFLNEVAATAEWRKSHLNWSSTGIKWGLK